MSDDRVWLHYSMRGWILLVALLCCCGDSQSEVVVVVSVSNLPARAATLSIQGTLDGKAAMSAQELSAPVSQFGVQLASGTTGHLVLTIQTLDADGCVQGSGQIEADLAGQNVDVGVAVTPTSPRICGNLAPCAAGMICTYNPKPASANIWSLWTNSPTDVWAVGDAATVLHFDGTSWKVSSVPVATYFNGVWGSGPKDVWAVGAVGTIIHYNGQTWTQSSSGAVFDLSAVYGVSPTDVWTVGLGAVAGSPGEFWHWNGTLWTKVPSAINSALLGIWASAPNDITAVGFGGMILHSDGTTMTSVPSGTTSDLHTVWGSSRNVVFAAGFSGGAMATVLRYDGTAWKKLTVTNYFSNLYGIVGDGTTVYGVGNSGVNSNLIKATAPYDTFAAQSSGNTDDLTSIVTGSNGIGWVGGKNGFLGYFDTRP